MKKFTDVRIRVFNFARDVIILCRLLPRDDANRVIIHQLLRSVTSIGANIEEAVGAHTRSDFAYTMNIAKKEARESFYWLRLIHKTNNTQIANKLDPLLQESEEILRILTATVKTSVVSKKKPNSEFKINNSKL
jgi:four helix bundle protein